jgi:hypothetical protein
LLGGADAAATTGGGRMAGAADMMRCRCLREAQAWASRAQRAEPGPRQAPSSLATRPHDIHIIEQIWFR